MRNAFMLEDEKRVGRVYSRAEGFLGLSHRVNRLCLLRLDFGSLRALRGVGGSSLNFLSFPFLTSLLFLGHMFFSFLSSLAFQRGFVLFSSLNSSPILQLNTKVSVNEAWI